MIEPLPDLPEGVIGFEVVGEVVAEDYTDTLIPALEAAAETGEVNLVFVLGERYDGYSAGAVWQDTKLGTRHHMHWHRTALVTDVSWMSHVATTLGFMVPGDFKAFPLAEREDAIAWAAARD
ncbi:STAS/SEC14 domain-containing protein [Aquihabitans daechungensis]|uniref:STAS/SEC14 domain-containing protein n=1 Tax=Aquihabitans daechungensis TaxID=1052257 RepID=UPI003BA276E5